MTPRSASGDPPLSVAVPWSLSHYIPLNGFHPLYRALFDHAPAGIALHAWDNVRLQERLAQDAATRDALLAAARAARSDARRQPPASIARRHQEAFWAPNRVLTRELAGQIEFHHTAPFPSLERPFVFHCESFAPVFFPFAEQGRGDPGGHVDLREHHRRIFASPLCLGIFSHIPSTLDSLSRFFGDPEIDRKLFASRIGLSPRASPPAVARLPPPGRPRFLFINSAHQDPRNFFLRGGHVVLRFWKEYLTSGRDGLLIIRCARPRDADLVEHGVDVPFIDAARGSLLWAEDYLAHHEIEALMTSASFFLLPSASLHSASILQAMGAGAVPVVTDTVGTSVYVTDDDNGIVLRGVREALWHEDPSTGILVDRYRPTPELDRHLVDQLTRRVISLLDAPEALRQMRSRALARARSEFSGADFGGQFWSAVQDLAARSARPGGQGGLGRALADCTLRAGDFARVFESVTHPMRRLYTGSGTVWELGGAFVHVHGDPPMRLHDWSVVAAHLDPDAPVSRLATSLPDLGGAYLALEDGRATVATRRPSLLAALRRFTLGWLELIVRYRRYVAFRWIGPEIAPDVELVAQGLNGHDVVRFFHRYYAIPDREGGFSPERAAEGGYAGCVRGYSREGVVQALLRSMASGRGPRGGAARPVERSEDAPRTGSREPRLVEEGYRGFNLVIYGFTYYAILQGDGAFDPSRVRSQDHKLCYHGDTLDELRAKVDLEPTWAPARWAFAVGGRGWLRTAVRRALPIGRWLDHFRWSQRQAAAHAIVRESDSPGGVRDARDR